MRKSRSVVDVFIQFFQTGLSSYLQEQAAFLLCNLLCLAEQRKSSCWMFSAFGGSNFFSFSKSFYWDLLSHIQEASLKVQDMLPLREILGFFWLLLYTYV